MSQLETLARLEGMTVMAMLERATFDSVVPAICTNPGCEFTEQLEPDAQGCRCGECGTDTVSSCLIIAGLV